MQQRIVILKLLVCILNHHADFIDISQGRRCLLPTKNCQLNNGVAFGPGYPLILHRHLAQGRYTLLSLTLKYPFVMLNIVKHLIADMQFR